MKRILKKIIPGSLKHEIKLELKKLINKSDANNILSHLYRPMIKTDNPMVHFYLDQQKPSGIPCPGSPFLLPPRDLRMGYAPDDDKTYLDGGLVSCHKLYKYYTAQGISLDEPGIKVMDWGCATGRVMRHFSEQAKHCEFWGLDQDAASIQWDKENLSPPFHYMTCTAYPHLPFEDNQFTLVYGLSVFTHILHFQDLWLMEFRRILKKGGCAIFTIHDENTIDFFRENYKPDWLAQSELSKGLQHDITVYGGGDWGGIYTFYKSKWIKEEWNRYLDVVAIEPQGDNYQTSIVLRKK